MTTETGKILLFQPLVSAGAGLDLRLVGIQTWLGRRLASHGVPGVIATVPPPEGESEGVTELVPSDGQILELMTNLDARWGLFTSFAVLGGRPHLAKARIFERPRDAAEPMLRVAKLEFDLANSDHLPAATYTLLLAVLQVLGKEPPTAGWDEAFGTGDLGVANHHLAALGGFELATRGHLGDHGEEVLASLLVGIRAGLKPAILGLPVVVKALRDAGSVAEDGVTRMVRDAVDAVGTVPASWHELLRELGVSATRIEN